MQQQEQSLLDGVLGNNQSDIEGLEQQLMDVIQSPKNIPDKGESAHKTATVQDEF